MDAVAMLAMWPWLFEQTFFPPNYMKFSSDSSDVLLEKMLESIEIWMALIKCMKYTDLWYSEIFMYMYLFSWLYKQTFVPKPPIISKKQF